jgi:hypothetical protein
LHKVLLDAEANISCALSLTEVTPVREHFFNYDFILVSFLRRRGMGRNMAAKVAPERFSDRFQIVL